MSYLMNGGMTSNMIDTTGCNNFGNNFGHNFNINMDSAFAAEAVVKVLESAAGSSSQNISNSLTRILSKLAVHADHNTGEVAEMAGTALRDNRERVAILTRLCFIAPLMQPSHAARCREFFRAIECDCLPFQGTAATFPKYK